MHTHLTHISKFPQSLPDQLRYGEFFFIPRFHIFSNTFFQIAHALGYLHAKDIVHGRLCSRNVFLESKVQLSVLDYAAGQSNVVYSSPQLLNQINTAANESEHNYSKLAF